MPHFVRKRAVVRSAEPDAAALAGRLPGLRLFDMPPRPLRAFRIPWDVGLGLWLAAAERLAGTSPGDAPSNGA